MNIVRPIFEIFGNFVFCTILINVLLLECVQFLLLALFVYLLLHLPKLTFLFHFYSFQHCFTYHIV